MRKASKIIIINNKDERNQLLKDTHNESFVIPIDESVIHEKIRQRLNAKQIGTCSNDSKSDHHNRINSSFIVQSNSQYLKHQSKEKEVDRRSTIRDLMSIYKKKHKAKQKQDGFTSIPPKPTNVEEYIDENINKIYEKFVECFAKYKTHYIGACRFGN